MWPLAGACHEPVPNAEACRYLGDADSCPDAADAGNSGMRVAETYFELEEFDHPASLTACVMLLGFLDRTLSRFGAREVEVNMLNCRYLGDDENLYDISWLVT